MLVLLRLGCHDTQKTFTPYFVAGKKAADVHSIRLHLQNQNNNTSPDKMKRLETEECLSIRVPESLQ